MQITALSGGVGGAKFLSRLLASLPPSTPERPVQVTIITNTGDDMTFLGHRICPDLDSLMYTLGGVVEPTQGWGRAEESYRVQQEMREIGADPGWFLLGDLDIATHWARSMWLAEGHTLSSVTERLCQRYDFVRRGVHLLPMSDDPVETHAVLDDDGAERAVHFQQWWVGMGAQPQPRRFAAVGLNTCTPAPGVLEAIAEADLVLLPPSNPVVSIGIILGVPGVRQALRDTPAPVIGVSPVRGGKPFRGHADTCLGVLGVAPTSAAVAELYRDFLTHWYHDPVDQVPADRPYRSTPIDTTLSDDAAATALIAACLSHLDPS